MRPVTNEELRLIQEIDCLWAPVYPYLARHISEVHGQKTERVLEVGPFCGAIHSLMEQKVGNGFFVGAFPQGMGRFLQEEGRQKGSCDGINIVETDPSLTAIKEQSIDLLIFRGALFFPSLFRVDYSGVWRVLNEGGTAMIGGGFGKYTPPDVIRAIGDRSKDLNLRIGKVDITTEEVRRDFAAANLDVHADIISEGGLWVIMKR
ncbi:MAG: hypothetical protein A4E65_02509 [Syntrophorhabdus sp. PtaU1.Bin153]|nr:MAG: hypothetical protein A4E65_02509 [Syntrophorhabdus sp. PtaU1.Bin153]